VFEYTFNQAFMNSMKITFISHYTYENTFKKERL